jgi:3-ketosteroid 9alpha-monooxygenase subunit B
VGGLAINTDVVEIEVLLDGKLYKIQGREGQRLIDAMEAAGIESPSSCRTGNCATCMCKLEEGSVALRNNQILDEDDIEQGWILACQAVPTSKRIRISYPS